MHIESVTLSNFRSFGPRPETIRLGPEVTALIGANGSGKSAFIGALRKVFGDDEHPLTRGDFHFEPGESPASASRKEMYVDVVLAFPELSGEQPAASGIPFSYTNMTAQSPGGELKARVRLEAVWERNESFEDQVSSNVVWVTTLGDVPFGIEDEAGLDKRRMQRGERRRIQIRYIPATRDTLAITKQALREVLRLMERQADWGEAEEEKAKNTNDAVQALVDDLPATKWLVGRIKDNWTNLHDAQHLAEPALKIDTQEIIRIIRALTLWVGPDPAGEQRDIKHLSEGQVSLMYLALIATIAELEAKLTGADPPDGFKTTPSGSPALVVFALEEPETHLAPFYLARLMDLLGRMTSGSRAMGVVTSHSASAVSRIAPEHLRHFRLDEASLSSLVNELKLPTDEIEAEKFVRTAVLAHPELYFARAVILGEGDSESLVLPVLADARDSQLDPAFVAMVPLAGRFVSHLWRLLEGLRIPYVTLLDFDLGRFGGGSLRLKYAYDQIQNIAPSSPPWLAGDVSATQYWKSLNERGMKDWIEWLETKGVFFSTPLDLDFLMVTSYPEAYGVDAPDDIDEAALEKAVFGSKGLGLATFNTAFTDNTPTANEMACYERLFKRGSKPSSHAVALNRVTAPDLAAHCPQELKRLFAAIDAILNHGAADASA